MLELATSGQLYLIVEIGESQTAADRLDLDLVVQAACFLHQRPSPIGLPSPQLRSDPLRSDHEVSRQRFDGPIEPEFAPPVVSFRGGRKNFYDQIGIQQRVKDTAVVLGLSA